MPSHPLAAIGIMLLSMLIFQISDIMVKVLTQTIPLLQLSFIRCLLAVIIIPLILAFQGKLPQLKTAFPRQQLQRGLLFTLLSLGYVYLLQQVPISLVAASFAAAPLLITATAPWLLKEKVSPRQWLAVSIGFSGVLLILQPDLSNLSLSMLVIFLQPVGYAWLLLISKQMMAQESGWTLNFYSFAVATLLILPWIWGESFALSAADWLIALFSAITSVIAFGLLIQAFHIGRASIVAPFEYSAILIALSADLLFWQLLPNISAIVGVGLVLLCATLQILEAKRQPPVTTAHVRLLDTHADED